GQGVHPGLVPPDPLSRSDHAHIHARGILIGGWRAEQEQAVLRVLGLLIEAEAEQRFVDVDQRPVAHASPSASASKAPSSSSSSSSGSSGSSASSWNCRSP